MQDFEGRVGVVTGGASGIGFATAKRFAEHGMKVVLADIEEKALDAAVSTLKEAGHEAIGVPTDVSQSDSLENLAQQTLDAFGKVNVVHNNAGVVRAGRIEELTLADWEWVLGVDLWSVIYGVKIFLPLIRQSGEGHIINTASTAGLQSAPHIGPYNVAKFGVVAMTETLHFELQGDQSPIGASVLCPGAVATRITESHRNRPDEVPQTETNLQFETGAAAQIAAGLGPDVVADQICAAIREKKFWIVTHPDWLKVLEKRVAGMHTGDHVAGFGG